MYCAGHKVVSDNSTLCFAVKKFYISINNLFFLKEDYYV